MEWTQKQQFDDDRIQSITLAKWQPLTLVESRYIFERWRAALKRIEELEPKERAMSQPIKHLREWAVEFWHEQGDFLYKAAILTAVLMVDTALFTVLIAVLRAFWRRHQI